MNFSSLVVIFFPIVFLCTSCVYTRYDDYRNLRIWELRSTSWVNQEIPHISHKIWLAPDDKLGEVLIGKINSAKNRVDLNVYMLSDIGLINALIETQRKGIAVRIILERSVYNSPTGNTSIFLRLKQEWIPITWADEVRQNFNHAKYIIVDNSVFIGTSNFTTTSFTKNREFFVETTDESVVKFMEQLFHADFLKFPFHSSQENIYLSPIDSRIKIENALRMSQKSIQIFAASLSDDSLLHILNEKQIKWVQVQVCLAYESNAERTTLQEWFQKQHIIFRQAKSPYVHAKSILIDNRILFIWSENFTKNSLDQNREIGLILKDSYFIKKYKETILEDCRDI